MEEIKVGEKSVDSVVRKDEKIVFSNGLAGFLVLNGCRMNHSKIDLKTRFSDKTRLIYFFEKSQRLEDLIDVYKKRCRESFCQYRLTDAEIEHILTGCKNGKL